MNLLIQWGLRISIATFAVLHFFTSVVDSPFLVHMLGVSGFLLLLFSGLRVSIKRFKLPSILLVTGVGIIVLSGVDIVDGLFRGIIQMRDVIGLLIIVPLISWVLREEPYIEDIMAYFYRFINTSRRFYFGLTAFTQIIAYFLLFGSISMMYQFVGVVLKKQTDEVWENFKGTAILRGFALATLWVISIPSFIFAVETLGASLWVVILQGFGLAIAGTLMATVFSYFQEKKYDVNLTPVLQQEMKSLLKHASSKEARRGKVIEFSFLFISLFGSILLLHAFLHVKLMLIIPIVIIIWTFAFYVYKRKLGRLKYVAKVFFKEDMTNQSYQLSVMLSVGVLIYGLNQTNFANNVVDGLYYMQSHLPFLNVLYLLPFIIIILGFFSLGPLTVMVLVAGILENMSIPYPPELIVLAITSGSAISIVLSPLIMPVIVLSASNGLSLLKNGITFNYKFAIMFYVLIQVYIQSIVYFWY